MRIRCADPSVTALYARFQANAAVRLKRVLITLIDGFDWIASSPVSDMSQVASGHQNKSARSETNYVRPPARATAFAERILTSDDRRNITISVHSMTDQPNR